MSSPEWHFRPRMLFNKQGSFFCFFLFVSEICSLFPTNIDSNSISLGNMSLTTKAGAFSISLFSIWLWVNLHLACQLCEDQILILTHISGDYKNLQAFSCVWTAFHNRVLFDFYIWCLDPKSQLLQITGKSFQFLNTLLRAWDLWRCTISYSLSPRGWLQRFQTNFRGNRLVNELADFFLVFFFIIVSIDL